jgi:SAM-dependent methyltransferase/acyl carrier protein
LLKGIPTAIIPDDVLKDPEELIQLLARTNVTRIVLVPSLLRAIMDTNDHLLGSVPKLKYWITSGEALPRELSNRFLKNAPGKKLLNLYGSSEVAADATSYEVSTEETFASVPIGRPISNTQVYIVDSKFQPVPIGVAGQLLIGGLGLARGYLNRPALTAEKFIPNPFGAAAGSRLYRTGDTARFLANGAIEFLGRADQQVKVRGFRIELEEIETVLGQHEAVKEAVMMVREDAAGDKRLVAYVLQNPDYHDETGAATTDSSTEETPQWQMVWDETYSQTGALSDPTFNIIGWNSSYTGQPIPASEMREWVDQTVARIRAERPKRVLEIGCGSGLLLFRLAPGCDQYVGTDFSPQALKYLETELSKPGKQMPQVKLLQQAADDFEGIETGCFDMVILNSVVQYFPNMAYLLRVLEGALNTLAPGGSVFIGDVRSLPLLEALHTSVELYRAPDSLPLSELRERVHKRLAQEQELVIDPHFFSALKQRFPQVKRAQVQPKRGPSQNELTRFRYDVTLHLNDENGAASEPREVDWHKEGLTVDTLRQMVKEKAVTETLRIKRVPNARLLKILKSAELLRDFESVDTVAELQRALDSIPAAGADPDELLGLSSDLPVAVGVRWSDSAGDGSYDLLFAPRVAGSSNGGGATVPFFADDTVRPKPFSAYVNNPMQGIFSRKLVPQLRAFVQDRLPEYMVPATFVLLDALPLTPNGKVDRRALPAPDSVRPNLQGEYVAPRSSVEEFLAGSWSEVLGIKQIGIHDNLFTELGGHSLLATQLVSRIREQFKIDLPLRRLFEKPTIAALAEVIQQAKGGSQLKEKPIARLSRDLYRKRIQATG